MSETYQSKRELREHISLRNVEAVASLTSHAQNRLVEALHSGLKRLPRAVEQLRMNPDTSVAELLNPPAQPVNPQSSTFPQHIQKELADLIQLCFPDMPRISAEALASADVMDIVQQTAHVHHDLFKSHHLRTDFVMVVLYALVRQTLERLEETIADIPSLWQIFDQSSLPWKPNDWRKQDAQTNR